MSTEHTKQEWGELVSHPFVQNPIGQALFYPAALFATTWAPMWPDEDRVREVAENLLLGLVPLISSISNLDREVVGPPLVAKHIESAVEMLNVAHRCYDRQMRRERGEQR